MTPTHRVPVWLQIVMFGGGLWAILCSGFTVPQQWLAYVYLSFLFWICP